MMLTGLELQVTHPERSLAFYRDVLGGAETAVFPTDTIILQLGEQQLCLRKAKQPHPAAVTLTFCTSNMDDTLAHLHRCGIQVYPDSKTAVVYHFCDPDGNLIQLRET